MTTFTVASNVSYAGVPTGVDLIDFTNAIHTVATATFNGVDFDNVKIKDNVIVSASAGTNNIVVNGGVDASGWTFDTSPAWSAADSITFNGISGADIIIGSSQNDTIFGGLGADTLVGGDGDDSFVYDAFDEFESGETIAGGNGTADTLRINVGQGFQVDVSGAGVLSGVEKVVFTSAGQIQLAGENVGTAAGLINAVTGSAGKNNISMFDSAIDLSGVTFTTWTAGEDAISLNGTAGNDTIVGSSQNDAFLGNGGADNLSGGAGDDFFSLQQNGAVAGEVINGGSGDADVVRLPGGNLSLLNITGVEQLSYSNSLLDPSFTITASGYQIGASAINTIIGDEAITVLSISGATVDLTGVAFTDWTAGSDLVVVNGTGGNDTLTGSNQRDTINGGDLNDILNGGAALDVLNGGLGNDTYVLGAESDTVTDTGGTDTITSTISRSLAGFGSIEKLTLLGAALTGNGNGLANTITGNASANTLDGKGGGDTMRGLGGNDTYVVDNIGDVVDESAAGSGGTDTVLSSVNIDLGGGTAKLVSLAPAASGLGAVENITLTGNAKEASGNSLANTITGNATDNVIAGREGLDSLTGNDGKDSFGFDTALNKTTNVDHVTDFVHAVDKILLDADIFADLNVGKLKKDAFVKAKKGKAKDGEDRIGYDKKTGALYADDDGKGGSKAIKFAILDGSPDNLSAKDFLVVA